MTESCGICLYLVDLYGPTSLRVAPDEEDYGSYINWIFHSEATLTFPQTIVLRYTLQVGVAYSVKDITPCIGGWEGG